MALIPGTNTWCTLVEADAYMVYRLGSDAWDDSDAQEAALVTAFNDLNRAGLYSLPGVPTAGTDDDVCGAQCEQALFRLQNLSGRDQRASTSAMGVKSAGLIQETYIEPRPGIYISMDADAALHDRKTLKKSAVILPLRTKDVHTSYDDDAIQYQP